jgi:hypothetical protein
MSIGDFHYIISIANALNQQLVLTVAYGFFFSSTKLISTFTRGSTTFFGRLKIKQDRNGSIFQEYFL